MGSSFFTVRQQSFITFHFLWKFLFPTNFAELVVDETVMFRSDPLAGMGRLPAAAARELPVSAQGAALDGSSVQHRGAGHVLGAVPGSRSVQHGECPRASHSSRVPGQG